jgi:hypothetical protein
MLCSLSLPMSRLSWICPFLALSGLACASAALAQDAWIFGTAIPCGSAPVYGLPFSQCSVSNTRTFRIGKVRSWRLTFGDANSEVAVGLYRLVDAGSAGSGMDPVSPSATIGWLQAAEALKSVTSGGSNWAVSPGGYATYRKGQRQCIGFVRNGPAVGGQIDWLLGAVFCREAASPIPASEAQFIADAVRVR